MENKKYQKAWHLVLSGKSNISEVSQIIGMDSEIIDLYTGFVQSHYQDSIEKMFPRIKDIVEFDWKEISQMYYEKYPPYAWDLNDLTKNFADFLQIIEEEFQLAPYLKELSRYELLEFFVYKDPMGSSMALNQLNPTTQIEQFEYDIASWVKEMDRLEEQGEFEQLKRSSPLKKMNFLAVCRDPKTHLCRFSQIGSVEIGIIELLKQQIVFDEVYSSLNELLPNLSEQIFDEALTFLKKQKIIY